jgi:hypothetical protein
MQIVNPKMEQLNKLQSELSNSDGGTRKLMRTFDYELTVEYRQVARQCLDSPPTRLKTLTAVKRYMPLFSNVEIKLCNLRN